MRSPKRKALIKTAALFIFLAVVVGYFCRGLVITPLKSCGAYVTYLGGVPALMETEPPFCFDQPHMDHEGHTILKTKDLALDDCLCYWNHRQLETLWGVDNGRYFVSCYSPIDDFFIKCTGY